MAITMKAARVNKGMTQEDVAKALGVSTNTYASYERDTSGKLMSLSTAIEFCKLVDLAMDDIIFCPKSNLK